MKNNNKGFTLIEMLVVVAIIGLLASVVVVGVGSARQRARDARRISDIRQIQNLLENSYAGANSYPAVLPATAPSDPTSGTYDYETKNSAQGYKLGTCLEADRGTGVSNSSATTFADGGPKNAGLTCTCNSTKGYCVES